ncbi:hypothetical protein KBD61_04900, partial [Patescibacteria group bacterium]|nr:hypothetical protein [Patescibacteria group bacterium]MBP9710329.1 hypothetical protein [Patescibacteria group bacterium]
AMRASGVGHDPKSAGKSLCGYISSMQASSNLTFHPQGMQQCDLLSILTISRKTDILVALTAPSSIG